MRFIAIAMICLGFQLSVAKSIEPDAIHVVADGVGEATIISENLATDNISQFVQAKAIEGSQLILSTDDPEVAQATVSGMQSLPNVKPLLFLPFGNLIRPGVSSFSDWTRKFPTRLKRAVQKDRVGLLVTIVNLGIGSYVWLHSSGVSLPQRVEIVSVNVILALIFGLDKELWGNHAANIGDRLFSPLLEKIGLIKADQPLSVRLEMTRNYLGSNVLYNLVNIPATIILSWDHLFSTFGFVERARGGAVSIFSGIGYGEMNRSVAADELPYAKLVAQGYLDLRQILVNWFVKPMAILHPHTYGMITLYVLAADGILGLIAYGYRQPLMTWINRQIVLVRDQWREPEPTLRPLHIGSACAIGL